MRDNKLYFPANPKTIMERNKEIKKEYYKIVQEFEEKKERILGEVVAPCFACKYDGEYRCEACSESFYEGFNKKNYPM